MNEYEKIIAIVAYSFIVLIPIVVITGTLIAFGENYNYKLTKNESDQITISELCYAKIDLGECKLLYGGIDTLYGEAIK